MYLDGIPPFPAELLQEAAREPPISFSGLSFWVAELHDILSRLRQLALAASPPAQWAERLDRRTTCYLLYEMEYLALSIPDLSQEFRSYDIGLPMIGQYTDSFSANSEKMHADDASIVEALVASVQTFVFAAVRGVPPKARIFQILLERLKRALDRRDTDVTEIWRRRNGLQVLLWIHVVAYSVARHGGDGGWWVEQLAELVGELGVYSEEDWRMRLGRVAWIESYFKDVLEELRADANVHLDDLYGNRGAGIGDSGVTEDLVTPSLPEEMFDPSAFELDDSREW